MHISDIVTDARAKSRGVILLAAWAARIFPSPSTTCGNSDAGRARVGHQIFTGYGGGYRPATSSSSQQRHVRRDPPSSAIRMSPTSGKSDHPARQTVRLSAPGFASPPSRRQYIEDIAFSNVEGGIVNNYGQ